MRRGEKLKTGRSRGAGKRFRVLHAVSAKGNYPKSLRLGAITSTISSGIKQMKCCSTKFAKSKKNYKQLITL